MSSPKSFLVRQRETPTSTSTKVAKVYNNERLKTAKAVSREIKAHQRLVETMTETMKLIPGVVACQSVVSTKQAEALTYKSCGHFETETFPQGYTMLLLYSIQGTNQSQAPNLIEFLAQVTDTPSEVGGPASPESPLCEEDKTDGFNQIKTNCDKQRVTEQRIELIRTMAK